MAYTRATGLLTKDTKLSYKKDMDFVDLGLDLQDFPDLGASADQVEVTTLADANRRYINGIKDFGALEFTFLYDGAADSAYRQLAALEKAKTVVEWKVTLPDGVEITFSGMCSVAIKSGAVNDAITFTLSINLASDVVVNLA